VHLRATVKTRNVWIQIRGAIPASLLEVLREEYGCRLIVRSEWVGEPMRDVLNAPLYSQDPREMNPGAFLRLFRQLEDLSQAELGRKLGGVTRHNVCHMENGRRPISRSMAMRLSRLFGASADKFIGP
jgi:DNA-binding XRE family transcriptional regulator